MKVTTATALQLVPLRLVAFCAITLTAAGLFAHDRPSDYQDFSTFWQAFRKATLEKDWRRLSEMCNFPVTVRGELDSDPVYRVGRRDFPKMFGQFLREGVFSPNEELNFIRKATGLEDDGRPARRVDDMIFRKTHKGWLLDTFYMQYTLD